MQLKVFLVVFMGSLAVAAPARDGRHLQTCGSEKQGVMLKKHGIIFTHIVPTTKKDDAEEYADGSEDPNAKKWKRPIFTHLVPAAGDDTSTEKSDE
ncbi:hypothetical protein VM1G_04711 [Cytospora mali]|uniref:Uncharacterized protein n=1 Tax=Cytospora mali TaxID=578113 RepID=A0A194VYM6_CYTMA|nr:hypothetical protein VM1G_04711 [Valsa mali]